MVFLHHFNPLFGTNYPSILIKTINELHIGVTIFFVLSRFIITYNYLSPPQINFRTYLWRRFTRIYPLYFLLTLGTYAIIFTYYGELKTFQWWALGMNITMLKGLFNDFIFTGIAQSWTLTVEESFYLSAPFIAHFLFKKPINYSVFLIISSITFTGILLTILSYDFPFEPLPNVKFMFHFTFFGRITEFVAGMLLAKCFVNKTRTSFMYFTQFGTGFILLSLVCLAILSKGDSTGDNSWLGIITNNIMLPIFGICPLLWGLIQEKTWLRDALSSPIFILMGNSSFAFYLIHMGIFKNYLSLHIPNLGLQFIILQLSAILLYKCIEQPLKIILR